MPSSAVRTFSDVDDYAGTIRAATVELAVMGRGAFNATLTRIDLHRLWMQRFSDNLPRVLDAGNLVSGRTYISFCTRPGPPLVSAGVELHQSAIMRHGQANQYYQRSSGIASFGTLSVPTEDIASVGAVMSELDLTPPRDAMLITPPPAAMARFLRLHAAAGRLAKHAPEIIADPDAARGLEQALLEALADCLGKSGSRANSFAQRQHAIVMHRFRRVTGENPEEPLFIPEICKAIRVSTRTLQMCCREHLGMGPKRYLLLRRMHLARRALRQAEPDATTVTRIATRYGFWQLGRFASEYQCLFGEYPSVTLRRAP